MPIVCNLIGHRSWVTCLGTYRNSVYSSSQDRNVYMWEPLSSTMPKMQWVHHDYVYSIVKYYNSWFSSSQDANVRCLTKSSIVSYPTNKYYYCLRVMGTLLVGGSLGGRVTFWKNPGRVVGFGSAKLVDAEKYEERWRRLRLLWLAYYKDQDRATCKVSSLPREVISMIVQKAE